MIYLFCLNTSFWTSFFISLSQNDRSAWLDVDCNDDVLLSLKVKFKYNIIRQVV